MLEHRMSGLLEIPKIWGQLLAYEELPAETPARPTDAPPRIGEPRPCRDDWRRVSLAQDGYIVSASLTSGGTNYWLTFEADLPDGSRFEADPEHELPDAGETHLYVTNADGQSLDLSFVVKHCDPAR